LKRKIHVALALAASVTAGTLLWAQEKKEQPAVEPSKVVIVAGDSQVTAGEFEDLIDALPEEARAGARQGQGKRQLAEDLVKLKLLAAEAKRQGLDKTPKFAKQMELMRENALAGALVAQLGQELVGEADVKKFYDANAAEFERVHARHILIATKGENALSDAQAKARAEEIRKQVTASPDQFAAIAKKESGDPGSKEDGGELQPFRRGELMKEFEDAAFKLAPNEISEPVRSEYGYHVIQLIKKAPLPLEQAKGEISERLKPTKLQEYVDNMQKKSNTKLDEAYFGPPAPAASAGADAK
jgi:parvulin-like peptidyl-prolyl isomerase